MQCNLKLYRLILTFPTNIVVCVSSTARTHLKTISLPSLEEEWSPALPWRRSGDKARSSWKNSRAFSAWSWWRRWCQCKVQDNTRISLHSAWLEHLEKQATSGEKISRVIPPGIRGKLVLFKLPEIFLINKLPRYLNLNVRIKEDYCYCWYCCMLKQRFANDGKD